MCEKNLAVNLLEFDGMNSENCRALIQATADSLFVLRMPIERSPLSNEVIYDLALIHKVGLVICLGWIQATNCCVSIITIGLKSC